MIAWVFFRAESFHQAVNIIKYLLNFNFSIDFDVNKNWFINGIFYISVGILIEAYYFFNIKKWSYNLNMNSVYRKIIEPAYLIILISAIIFLRGKGQEFIYFQF